MISAMSFSQSDALTVTANGDIGVGTDTPEFDVDISRGTSPVVLQLRDTSPGGQKWAFAMDSSGAREGLSLTRVGSGIREFRVDNSGNFIIQGSLITGGGGACDPGPCDATFTTYEVESIEEHAKYMWENSHLWGVGPTPEGEPINITKKVTGILHELEKAHIYIERLHRRINTLQEQHSDVILAMEERLSKLEAVSIAE